MSIRSLATEVYRAMKEVEELEKKLEELPWGSPGREDLEDRLRISRAEHNRLRALLDGAKE